MFGLKPNFNSRSFFLRCVCTSSLFLFIVVSFVLVVCLFFFSAGFGGCYSSKSGAPEGVRKVLHKTIVFSQETVGSIIHARGISAQFLKNKSNTGAISG